MTLDEEIIERFFQKNAFTFENAKGRENLFRSLAETIRLRAMRKISPERNQSLAFTIEKPKTAALAFDRVYQIPYINDPIPEAMAFYGATRTEVMWWSMNFLYAIAHDGGLKTDLDDDIFEVVDDPKESADNIGDNLRFVCSELPGIFGKLPTILYASSKAMVSNFPDGTQANLYFAFENLKIVDETKLDWKQVADFRSDPEVKIKYKRLVRWLDKEILNATSSNQIEDLIAIKLDDYSWALKKHGIETINGCVSSLLDTKFIGTTSAATILAALTTGTTLAAFTSLSLVLGKTIVTFGTKYIDGTDQIRKDNYEIAYVYEAKNKL